MMNCLSLLKKSFFIFLIIFYGSLYSFAQQMVESKELIKIIMKKEKDYKIPMGLLLAIADVESGINHWVINDSGQKVVFKNKENFLSYIRKNKHNSKGIDIGVMQINLKYHRKNFRSLEHMIDPVTNVDYAARFLCKLRQQYKSWWLAVGAYHNMHYKVNIPYKEKVFKSWRKIKRRILFSKI